MYICSNCGSQIADCNTNCFACGASGTTAKKLEPDAFNQLEDAAYKGDIEAMLFVALAHLNGVGAEKDVYMAAYWMEQAAEKGLPAAKYQLSIMYRDGNGVQRNPEKAVELMASYENSKDAYNSSSHKPTVTTTTDEAFDWFGVPASPATPPADFVEKTAPNVPDTLCEETHTDNELLIEKGDELFDEACDNDDEDTMLKAAEYYRKAGENDCAEGYTSLAWVYIEGKGIEIDTDMALYYLDQAKTCADYDEETAQEIDRASLWIYLTQDNLSPRDAVRMYKRMAKTDELYACQQFVDAMDDLGPFSELDVEISDEDCEMLLLQKRSCAETLAYEIDENGEDEENDLTDEYIMTYLICVSETFEEDDVEEFDYFRDTLIKYLDDEDYDECYIDMADVLDEYKETNEDCAEIAFLIYHNFAEQGDLYAQFMTGFYYNFGYGVEEDLKEANAWYKTASDGGEASASSMLGFNLQRGYGCAVDYQQALQMYQKSVDQGQSSSLIDMGKCYEEMGNNLEAAKAYKRAMETNEKDAQELYKSVFEKLSFMQKMSL